MASEPGRCEATVGLIVADERGRYFAIARADLERFRVPEPVVAALAAIAEGGEPVANGEELSGHADAAADAGTRAVLGEVVSGWASRRARIAVRRVPAWQVLRM